jgi:hypothetical protein
LAWVAWSVVAAAGVCQQWPVTGADAGFSNPQFVKCHPASSSPSNLRNITVVWTDSTDSAHTVGVRHNCESTLTDCVACASTIPPTCFGPCGFFNFNGADNTGVVEYDDTATTFLFLPVQGAKCYFTPPIADKVYVIDPNDGNANCPTDDQLQACSQRSGCATCTQSPTCGMCGDDCVTGASLAPTYGTFGCTPQTWTFSATECCALHVGCGECGADPSCGWCTDGAPTCLPGGVSNPSGGSCAQWDFSGICTYIDLVATSRTQQGMNIAVRVDPTKGAFQVFSATQGWETKFFTGVALSTTKPGSWPGELGLDVGPQLSDFRSWLADAGDLGVTVVWLDQLMPPAFYAALQDYNNNRVVPMRVLQGIPAPDALGTDTATGVGVWEGTPSYESLFEASIRETVQAVHGSLATGLQPYTLDVSRLVMGYIIGTQWAPSVIEATNAQSRDVYTGDYFASTSSASNFERWLARMVDVLAKTEVQQFSWQHPVAVKNWMGTDPMSHFATSNPNVVNAQNIVAKASWEAGTFSAFDLSTTSTTIRFEYDACLSCKTSLADSFSGYLRDLKSGAASLTHPLVISSVGLGSSRNMGALGANSRHDGGHTEQTQGVHLKAMLYDAYDEGVAMAIVSELTDSWQKRSSNTHSWIDSQRLPYWKNVLSPASMEGLVDRQGEAPDFRRISLDGATSDWLNKEPTLVKRVALTTTLALSITHDPTYLYVLLEKTTPGATWGLGNDGTESVYLGFNSVQVAGQGSQIADGVDGAPTFREEVEYVIALRGGKNPSSSGVATGQAFVSGPFDPYHYYHNDELATPERVAALKQMNLFRPWTSRVSEKKTVQCKTQPMEAWNIGKLRKGADGDYEYGSTTGVLEIRVPWVLIGFIDPSRQQVRSPFNHEDKTVPPSSLESSGVRLEVGMNGVTQGPAVEHTWTKWGQGSTFSSSRRKASFAYVRDFATDTLPMPAPGCAVQNLVCKAEARKCDDALVDSTLDAAPVGCNELCMGALFTVGGLVLLGLLAALAYWLVQQQRQTKGLAEQALAHTGATSTTQDKALQKIVAGRKTGNKWGGA